MSIRATLTMCGRPETAAQALVRRAKESGGRDNISVIVIDVVSGGAVAATDGGTDSRLASAVNTTSMLESTTVPVRRNG